MNGESPPQAVRTKPPVLPYARTINIALRTAHIGVSAVVVGGHVFGVSHQRILAWLYLTIASGVILTVVEAFPHCHWFYQGRGVMVLSKLFLLCLIPWMWPFRVYLLAAVIVIASVGSHMPARFRYYSLVHRRVLEH